MILPTSIDPRIAVAEVTRNPTNVEKPLHGSGLYGMILRQP